jgi:hypothetical protein
MTPGIGSGSINFVSVDASSGEGKNENVDDDAFHGSSKDAPAKVVAFIKSLLVAMHFSVPMYVVQPVVTGTEATLAVPTYPSVDGLR